MAAIGVFSLVLATFQYRRETKPLKSETSGSRLPIAEIVAGLISAFGLAVLFSAIFKK
jgi:hypothetical protein